MSFVITMIVQSVLLLKSVWKYPKGLFCDPFDGHCLTNPLSFMIDISQETLGNHYFSNK